MTPRELAEYEALRATIRERGSARVWIFVVGFVAWGTLESALLLASAALPARPIAALPPLLLVAAVFEAVVNVYRGVERVGRYVQVFFEEPDASSTARWEHAAMAFGRPVRGGGSDPLFSWYFLAATILNFLPVLLAEPAAVEWTSVGSIHALFVVRVIIARREAGRQRAADLARFQQLKGS